MRQTPDEIKDTADRHDMPQPGDTVRLDAAPAAVGLYEVAREGDRFTVVDTWLTDEGLGIDVRPIGGGDQYRLLHRHVEVVG